MVYEDQFYSAWYLLAGVFAFAVVLFYRYVRWIKALEIRLIPIALVALLTFYPSKKTDPVEHWVPAFMDFGFVLVDSKFDFNVALPILQPMLMASVLVILLGLLVFLVRKLVRRPQLPDPDERHEPQI